MICGLVIQILEVTVNLRQIPMSVLCISGPSNKGCPHIRSRGIRQKWTNADSGRGWLAKCGRLLGKKIIATIFVKLTHIKGSMSVYDVMPVCHVMSCLYHSYVLHLLPGQTHLLECYYRNCLIGTHMCVHPVSEWSVFCLSVRIVHKLQCFK